MGESDAVESTLVHHFIANRRILRHGFPQKTSMTINLLNLSCHQINVNLAQIIVKPALVPVFALNATKAITYQILVNVNYVIINVCHAL